MMAAPEILIERGSVKRKNKEYVKAFLCQRCIDNIAPLANGYLDYTKNTPILEAELNQIIDDARNEKPNIIIFPELSITQDKIVDLQRLSNDIDCIIVGGSQYYEANGKFANKCPVIFPNKEPWFTVKNCSSFPETEWLGNKFSPGNQLYKFLDTVAGNFGVLICVDFLAPSLRDALLKKLKNKKEDNLDFLIVIALQDDSKKHYKELEYLIHNHSAIGEDGLYILYANCIHNKVTKKRYSDGCSSFWGYLKKGEHDRNYFIEKGILKELPNIDNCLAQLSNNDLYLQITFNVHKKLGLNGRRTPQFKGQFPFIQQFPFQDLKLVKRNPSSSVTEKPSNSIATTVNSDSTEKINITKELSCFLKRNISKFNDLPLLQRSVDNIGLSSAKLKFEDFYFPISVSKDFALGSGASVFNKTASGNVKTSDENFTNVEEFLINGYKRLIIKGNPGQGKTTFANWLTTALSNNLLYSNEYSIPNYTSVSDLQLIPLTINCKKLSKFKVGHNYNPQYLIEKILELNGFELKDERKLITQLTSYFKQQKVIIIIDGIEEIQDTELRDKFCLYIDGLVDNYSENFFVLTSRIYGYTGIKHIIRGDFLPLRIQDLSKESKQIFLNRISACLNLTKKDQQVILTELNNRHIESLTRTALNLTNICLLYKSKNQFPSNLREVYLGSLEILFARKNISAGITYPLNKELKLLLGKLSYDLLINNKIEFTQADFSNTLNHFLSYYSVENKSIRNGKKIFSYIRSQVGLFDDVRVENNKGEIQEVYKFFHDSYREFLAGYFISSYNFNQDHIVERIHEIIKYESYITKIKRKEVKLLKISDGRFSIINFAIACCDPKEKIEVLNSLIKGGSKINQTQKLKANGVMALHCISNNPEKALTHVAKKVFKFFCSHIDKNDYSISLKNISEETKGKVDATETNFALKRIVDSSWSKLFTQAVLEQYLESYNSESINSEKLQLIYLDLILQSSLNLKSNKNYLECNIIKRRFEEKLRYCFDIVNIGYTEASTYPTEQFKKSVKKVVANLFIILGGENSILRSAAAFALYWLNNAKSSPKGIWEPNQKEYNLLVEIILKLKDRDVCLSIFPVLRKSCDKKVFYEGNVALQVASWLDRKTIEIPVIKLKEINAKLCGVLIQLFNSTHLDSLKSLCAIELASYGYYDNRISKYLITQIDSFNESRVVKIVVPYIIALNDLTIAPKLLGLLLKDDMNTSFYATLILSRYLNRSNYEMIKENSNMQLQKKFRRNVATLSKTLKKWEENRTSYYDYCIKLLSDDCYQVMGKDTSGQTAWYFVLVDPDKVVSFTKHKQGDSYDLKNYGVIVRAGYGESVPEKVQKELKDKYGFDNF